MIEYYLKQGYKVKLIDTVNDVIFLEKLKDGEIK